MPRGRLPERVHQKGRRGRPPKFAISQKEMDAKLVEIKAAANEVLERICPQPYIYVGMDQRSTKSLGNYETFVFGFSLTMPTPFEPGDDISKPETCDRLRKKYEGVSNFISALMRSVEGQVDVAQDKIATPPVVEVVNPPASKPIGGNQNTLTPGLPPGSQNVWPPSPPLGPQGVSQETATTVETKLPVETPPASDSAF